MYLKCIRIARGLCHHNFFFHSKIKKKFDFKFIKQISIAQSILHQHI